MWWLDAGVKNDKGKTATQPTRFILMITHSLARVISNLI